MPEDFSVFVRFEFKHLALILEEFEPRTVNGCGAKRVVDRSCF